MVVGLSLATVAVTTGFISYTHISALTVILHGSWKTAHLMPLAVDGQIAIGSVILMEVKDRRRWLGLIGFVPGLLESLFANWESGIVHGLLAASWSTVPAQAFACSTFLFEVWLRYRRGQQKPSFLGSRAAAPGPAAVPYPVALRTASRLAELVAPAAVPAFPDWAGFAVRGPVQPLPGVRPAAAAAARPAAPRPAGPPPGPDTRLPLPGDPAALRELVNRLKRNELVREYQVTKHKADQLREQYLDETEEVAADAA
jgi:hypothetical protein